MMSAFPDALLINTSPSFQKLHGQLCAALAQVATVGCWEYQQTADEPLSLEIGVTLLHDYLKSSDRPLHLLGHGSSGCLALLYARRHPERVRSLTLLAVGAHPAVDWHAHYYARLQLLPCSRRTILRQMACGLFGHCSQPVERELVELLDRDLRTALSPHTLFRRVQVEAGGVSVPLLACGSQDDPIVAPNALSDWQSWLKPSDAIWLCPSGRYFFHHRYPKLTARRIAEFWQTLDSPNRDRRLLLEMLG